MARIIDVIDHPNVMDDELAYREPQRGGGDFRMGSQVIVQESQTAVFVRQGEVLDKLGPGSHTLSTGNLPVLSRVLGLVTNGRNPFTADVYFINLKDLPQVGWGTNPPIVLETPGKGLGAVLLVTHGVIDIGIDDPLRFLNQYAIGKPILRVGDIKDRIQSMLLGEIGTLLSGSGATSVPEANKLLNDLEGAMLARLNEQFAAIGMRIKAFEANPFTAKEATLDELRNYISIEAYERIRRLDVAQSAASNTGMGGGLAAAGVGLGVGQNIGAAMNPGAGRAPAAAPTAANDDAADDDADDAAGAAEPTASRPGGPGRGGSRVAADAARNPGHDRQPGHALRQRRDQRGRVQPAGGEMGGQTERGVIPGGFGARRFQAREISRAC